MKIFKLCVLLLLPITFYAFSDKFTDKDNAYISFETTSEKEIFIEVKNFPLSSLVALMGDLFNSSANSNIKYSTNGSVANEHLSSKKVRIRSSIEFEEFIYRASAKKVLTGVVNGKKVFMSLSEYNEHVAKNLIEAEGDH